MVKGSKHSEETRKRLSLSHLGKISPKRGKVYSKNPGEYIKRYRRSVKGKYSRYKKNSKSIGRVFALSFEEFSNILSQPCFYCGEGSYGIDRKNNNEGYTLNNSLPACWICNRMKINYDFNFFIEHCKKISRQSFLRLTKIQNI